MRKILLPTDFSENAYNAISYAVQLSKEQETHFILLHTLYNASYILHSSLSSIYKNNSHKGLEKLEKRIKEDFPNSKHSFELVSSFNPLYTEIKDRVESKEIGLVVMGTNGAAGGEELLFGTHTVHAIKIAKCPVLAIPSHFKNQSPENIVFATKYGIDFTEYQMDFLKQIVKHYQSTLHILHANFGKPLSESQEKGKADLAHFFEDVPHEFHEIRNDSVPEAIETFQKDKPVGLLVMVKHRHTFLERLLFSSIIHEIGFNAEFPFLVLPTEKYDPMIREDEQ